MKLSTTIAAAAISTLPLAASAVTLEPIEDGGTTNVTFDTIYEFDVVIADGGFTHTFVVDSNAAGVGAISLTNLIASVFEGLTVSWSDGGSGGANELVTTEFLAPGSLTQTLDVTWTSTQSTQNFDGVVQVSSIPVPAGLVLMGTALAGFGVLRRKK